MNHSLAVPPRKGSQTERLPSITDVSREEGSAHPQEGDGTDWCTALPDSPCAGFLGAAGRVVSTNASRSCTGTEGKQSHVCEERGAAVVGTITTQYVPERDHRWSFKGAPIKASSAKNRGDLTRRDISTSHLSTSPSPRGFLCWSD